MHPVRVPPWLKLDASRCPGLAAGTCEKEGLAFPFEGCGLGDAHNVVDAEDDPVHGLSIFLEFDEDSSKILPLQDRVIRILFFSGSPYFFMISDRDFPDDHSWPFYCPRVT